jgi:hypothetical protein
MGHGELFPMTTRIRNRAKCLKCGDIIESKYRHDFVKCSCGAIFVDGGNEYWRAGASDFKFFERIDNLGKKLVTPSDENDI